MDVEKFLAGIPIPSSSQMEERRRHAHSYTIVFLRKGPASRVDEARNERLQLEHLQHLARLQLAGKLVLNGPILDDHDILGISVYEADVAEARAYAEADPKVIAGYLTVEAIPWMAVPAASGKQTHGDPAD